MPRIHAFELEDQPWFPRLIRDYATDFLQFMIDLGASYAPVAPLIQQALEKSGSRRIVDLGSGGGGPWLRLAGQLEAEGTAVEVLLTDLYPSQEAMERVRAQRREHRVSYHDEPVNAMQMPAQLSGFRTLFTALHHFRPEEARAILADAVRSGQGIGAFEFSERSLRCVLGVAIAPLLVLLVTPVIRPLRWSRVFWTYLIPLVPLVVLFDGIVSCLRTYSPQELRSLVDSLEASDYAWQIGTVRGRAPVPVTYLIGYRTNPARDYRSTGTIGGPERSPSPATPVHLRSRPGVTSSE